ncbi:hypothetical protein PV05_07455 [Exophiala xenobiotica]|uniref:Uncharacterized protein n=1 Tax=Exophiala xenobiotica TaxID=348802 RepID=A0A0D2EKF9_9EURO|nr:uncharacterized protein PV05_07455 [Exophiala xenobiotica]KIW55150.1 hypothetical protein PV05_07455 [Exophiala xenobiotica]
MRICGSFIARGNHSTPSIVATGASSTSSNSTMTNPASDWPKFTIYSPISRRARTTNDATLLDATQKKQAEATDAICGGVLGQPYLNETRFRQSLHVASGTIQQCN